MNDHHWKGIRSFLAVADHGSFTSAAEATGLSKASLSQQVSELEQSLGVQLLHRTTRSLRLSDVGQGYYDLCKAGMVQFDSAREWASQSNQALSGAIRVNSVGGLIGESLIAPMLIEFQQQHPEVQVSLNFSSLREDLLSKPYDVVMRMGELPDSSLVSRRLGRMVTRYVASSEFVARHGPFEHPNEIKHLPIVCGSVTHWSFVRGDERVDLDFDPGFQIANGRVMRQAALAGLGISRLADVYVQGDIAAGRLVEVLPEWRQDTPITLICPPARYQVHRVKALMDWLVEGFELRYRQLLDQHHI